MINTQIKLLINFHLLKRTISISLITCWSMRKKYDRKRQSGYIRNCDKQKGEMKKKDKIICTNVRM